jgi:hypothetical protein
MYSMLILTSMLFFCMSIKAGSNILWEDDFDSLKSWKLLNLSAQQQNGEVMLRENGEKSYGKMYGYIPFDFSSGNSYPYLQVKIGKIENTGTSVHLTGGGRFFGGLYEGVNTFDLRKTPRLIGKANGKFSIYFIQKGKKGTAPGNWITVNNVKITQKPYNGIIVSLIKKSKNDNNTVKCGDTLFFRYFSKQKSANSKLKLYFATIPDFNSFLFSKKEIFMNDNGKNGDKQANDGIFSAKIPVTSESQSLKLADINGKIHLIAYVKTAKGHSYVIPYLKFDIVTKNLQPAASLQAATPLARANRTLWTKLTKGVNIAAGKKVSFAPKPNYRITSGGDSDNLTDLRLSSMNDDSIWFDKLAVGWRHSSQTIFFDLDKVQPVSRIVARFLGGGMQNKFFSPKEFIVYISKDGKKYYKTASMQKLMPGEAGQSDFNKFYYLEESGIPFAYPFSFKVNAEARYVVLMVKSSSICSATDEIAVIKANKKEISKPSFNHVYKENPAAFSKDGILFGPRTDYLAITKNITTPSFFTALDMRTPEERKKTLKLVVELPPGLNIINAKYAPMTEALKGGEPVNLGKAKDDYIKWSLPLRINRLRHDHVFIIVKSAVPANAKARFYALIDNKKGVVREIPIKILEMPKVPKLDFFVCLTWMSIMQLESWPDFFKSYRAMGFNVIPFFPRSHKSPEKIVKLKKLIAKARKEGFKVCMMESPTHEMSKIAKRTDQEVFSLIKNKKNTWLCPSYTGKHYQEMLKKISKRVKMFKPDFVCLDIEDFGPGSRNANKCSRCKSGQQQSGKDLKEYLFSQGSRLNSDIKLAIKKGCVKGQKTPILSSYDKHATHRFYHGFEDFMQNFPKTLDKSEPSLYVAGNAQTVHDQIRQEYFLLKKNKQAIHPWLTGGTYGEFEPYKIEQMVLESLMNGASGINYFAIFDFDTPMDFFYHTRALSLIAPYQKLLINGDVLTQTGSNKQLTYSIRRKGKEMLLLVGNYKNANGNTQFQLPYSDISIIKELNSGQDFPRKNPLKFSVNKNSFNLFYIKGK